MLNSIGRHLQTEDVYFMRVPDSKVDFCKMGKDAFNADICDNIDLIECIPDDRTSKPPTQDGYLYSEPS